MVTDFLKALIISDLIRGVIWLGIAFLVMIFISTEDE